jgi:hypothetical protein
MMNRRVFLGTMAGGLLAAPLDVGAQAGTRSGRIGHEWEGRYPRCDKGKRCDTEGRA